MYNIAMDIAVLLLPTKPYVTISNQVQEESALEAPLAVAW